MTLESLKSVDTRDMARDLRDLYDDVMRRRSASRLESAIRDGCWIYGAGGYGRTVRRLIEAQGAPLHGFVDRRGGDGGLAAELGLPVLHPDALSRDIARGNTLIVALHNFAADQRPVVAWAREAGFAEVIIPAELPDILGAEAGSYWLTGRRSAVDAADHIEAVAGLLADRRSIDVLRGAAQFRVSADHADHPASHLPSQYFPPDVPLTGEPLRAVDGGAFTGDIHEAAGAAGVTFEEWWAFEPDPENFKALIDMAARVGVPRTALFPCGLGDNCVQIRFSSGENAGSRLGEGDSVAQVVSLDQILPGIRPNYVKLDIEGFEREAIRGMAGILHDAKPHIAISIYHKPEDLWELPLLIHDHLPDARLYIRQHGFNGFDTVLYAVPAD